MNLCKASILLTGYLLLMNGNIEAQSTKAQKAEVQSTETSKAEVRDAEMQNVKALKAEAQDTIIQSKVPEAKAQSIEDKAIQELQADPSARTRFITRSTMYGIGFSNVFDTYLSPQEYTGIDFRIARESMRMTRMAQGRLSLQNFFQADVSYTHNHVDNNNTIAGLVNWNYGLHYNFPITSNFKLLAGGLGDFNGGFVYNLRNNNNPASARAYINLDASGMAIWNLRIKTYPITLRYQMNLPVIGVMFSPHYGQSYYEIFTLDNSNGVVKFTSLHNQPSLRQLFTLDFPVGQVKMRLAYIWDAQQSRVNGIKTHTYSHVFMVGFVKEIYLLRNKRK